MEDPLYTYAGFVYIETDNEFYRDYMHKCCLHFLNALKAKDSNHLIRKYSVQKGEIVEYGSEIGWRFVGSYRDCSLFHPLIIGFVALYGLRITNADGKFFLLKKRSTHLLE